MNMNNRDRERLSAYTKEHGRLPDVDNPDFGEFSDHMRSGNPIGFTMIVLLLVVLALFGWVVLR